MSITSSTEDYLKVVWNAHEWSKAPVTVSALAARLGLSASSVSEAVRKLTDRGLLTHARYGDIALTDEGARQALTMVRKHRLIETFLVTDLGYAWDEVHDEAETLEHAVSDLLIDRIDARLGHPTHDPHGDPIPSATGVLPDEAQVSLVALMPGDSARIARVRDHDPELLRHLETHGVGIGTQIRLIEHNVAAGTLAVEHDNRTTTLGIVAASAIRTTPADPVPHIVPAHGD